MKRINNRTVEMTKREQAIAHYHELAMNDGLTQGEAVDHVKGGLPPDEVVDPALWEWLGE